MIHHSNEYNIDITAQNINKYTALQYIFDADVKYIACCNMTTMILSCYNMLVVAIL